MAIREIESMVKGKPERPKVSESFFIQFDFPTYSGVLLPKNYPEMTSKDGVVYKALKAAQWSAWHQDFKCQKCPVCRCLKIGNERHAKDCLLDEALALYGD